MSSGDDRGRPGKETASKSNTTDRTKHNDANPQNEPFDALAGMRRRQDAARRLPPLESGKRDPHLGMAHDSPAHRSAVMEGLRALWRLADPDDRPVVERIAQRVHEGGAL